MKDIIDIHTHILPEIDDGSQSLDESIKMLRMESEQGICKIIATPHFYPHHDTLEHFLDKRERAIEKLKQAMVTESNLPLVEVGAEVHYFSGIGKSESIRSLTIGNSDCILVEMPVCRWTKQMYDDLTGISGNLGITPIVAHIDRYIKPWCTWGIPEKIAEMPVLVQANASFFLERRTSKMALRMLKKNQIHLLGSDCHNLTSRPPNLGEVLSIIENNFENNVIEQLLDNQSIILSNC